MKILSLIILSRDNYRKQYKSFYLALFVMDSCNSQCPKERERTFFITFYNIHLLNIQAFICSFASEFSTSYFSSTCNFQVAITR